MGSRLRAPGVVVLAWVVVACGGGGGGLTPIDAAVTDALGIDAGDPPRSVTTVLRRQGFGPNCLDFETGAVTTCPCGGCAVDISHDAAGNFTGAGAEIVSVGPVADLASVAAIPSSGYTASAAAIVGEGYVLRTSDHNYYRVFVERFVLEAGTNGVIGLSMKWAPFDCSLYVSYKCDTVLNASGVSCAGLHPDSACDYAACTGEYLDCDTMRANGCELNGNVGVRCSNTLNASGVSYTCAQGCDYASCNAGNLDCDGNRMNGCELVVATRCASTVNAVATYSCQTSTCDYTACNTGYHDCDGNRVNGCELQGTGCPIVLATGGGGIALDATSVYYINNNNLHKVPIGGGASEQLQTGVSGPLHLDANNIYFIGGGFVFRLAKSGGTAVNLRPSPGDTPSSLLVDDTYAYFALNRGACCGDFVRRVPTAGGGPEVNLADGPYFPFAHDATSIYVRDSSSISRIPKSGGSPVQVVPLPAPSTDAVSDGTYIYWSANEASTGVVKRVLLAGGSVSTIVSAVGVGPSRIAVDATHVYFADANGGGFLNRVPLTGGTVEVLSSGQSGVGGIAVDATHVYWTSGSRVLKLAK